MAEAVGFEPTEPFGSPVFKTEGISQTLLHASIIVRARFSRGGRSSQLAPETGFEPVTERLTAACSTTELLWNCMAGVEGVEPSHNGIKTRCLTTWRYSFYKIGRNRGIRTPGPLIPNEVLYQAELYSDGTPSGIRTRVGDVKGR